MKKFITFALAIVCANVLHAQSSLIATLTHDGNISAFYGADALKEAAAVAEIGDIITLSGGQFNAATITKPIILRGVGMSVSTDSENPHEATYIQNDFVVNIADSLSGRLMMENLYFRNDFRNTAGHIKNAQFLRCNFSNITYGSGARMSNSTFIHCRVRSSFRIGANSTVSFINSVINNPNNFNGNTSIMSFDNCFLHYGSTTYPPAGVYYSYLRNCIIQSSANSAFPSTTIAYNCVGIGYNGLFSNMLSSNTTNQIVSDMTTLFKYYSDTSNSKISDNYNFELTDEAKATYLGSDGTQVGIYGGNLPYDENPIMPQITKCNVASKSTADGKLSVDIEVKAAEY